MSRTDASRPRAQLTRRALHIQDFRLDVNMARVCKKFIDTYCMRDCMIEEGVMCDGQVIHCVKTNIANIDDPDCLDSALRILKQGREGADIDRYFSVQCESDIEKMCAAEEESELRTRTRGTVHGCLMVNFEKLSKKCRAAEMESVLSQIQMSALDPWVRQRIHKRSSTLVHDAFLLVSPFLSRGSILLH